MTRSVDELFVCCRSHAGKVDIRSVGLVIEGSDMVQRLRLNERVEFSVRCQFSQDKGEGTKTPPKVV